MRIIFAGTPETAISSLQALIESNHEVIAVITRPDAPSGRGRVLTPSPIAVVASENAIPVLKLKNLRDPSSHEELDRLNPDAIAVVAYGALVPAELLTKPRFGWINLHFSILPSWRGAAPVPYAIKFGDEITGATTFQIDEGLDTGPIFGVVTEEIRSSDTTGTLLERLSKSGARLLVETLSGIEAGQLRALVQNPTDVSFAPKISSSEAEIDWRAPALAIDRAIRAYTPEPGAWTTFNDERIEVGPIAILETSLDGRPGELIVTKHEVFVVTGSATIQLDTIRAAGKKAMPAADWARGVRAKSGDAFSMSHS